VSDIRQQLHREGYNYEVIQGPVMEQAHQCAANVGRPEEASIKKPIKVMPKKKR
jgi:hypothetical protein